MRALAYSPDGTTLATGGEDGEVKLWDPASGRERASLPGHTDMVTCLAFSARGGILATGSLDTTVKIWEAGTWRERASLQGHRDGVSALAFGAGRPPDGHGRLRRLGAPLGARRAGLLAVGLPGVCRRGPRPGVLARRPDPPRRRGGRDRTLGRPRRLDRPAARKSTGATANAIASAPDGTSYAAGMPDGEVRLFDADSDRPIASFGGHAGAVMAAAYSPDSRLIASGGRDGTVCLWDVRGRRLLGTFAAAGRADRRRPVLARRPDAGRRVRGHGRGRGVGVIGRGDVLGRRRSPRSGARPAGARARGRVAHLLARRPDARDVRTSTGSSGSGTSPPVGRSGTLTYAGCRSVAFSPDGRYLAAARDGGDVVLWDVRGGRQLGLLKGHRDRVTRIVFAPDGRSLATAGDDKTVKLWSLAARRQTARATLKGDADAHLVRRLLARRQAPGRRRRADGHARHGDALGRRDPEGQGDAGRPRPGRRHGRVLARRPAAGLGRLGRDHPDLGRPRPARPGT